MWKENKAKDLTGKTVSNIDIDEGNAEMQITCTDGTKYLFHHVQDCCESVNIVDVNGDPKALVGYKLMLIEEDGFALTEEYDKYIFDESCTTTEFVFHTSKDSLAVRWIGCSNGYYSEEVDISDLTPKKDK